MSTATHQRNIQGAVRAAVIIGLTPIFLFGCAEHQHSDLENYVNQVKAQQKSHIEPLPTIEPYETYIYKENGRRDPFTPSFERQQTFEDDSGTGVRPNKDRRKEPLEEFPLDSLRMVGTLEKETVTWAIIDAGEGGIHRVTLGNYLGQNHGRIVRIGEEKVDLVEIIPNGLGGWRERDSSVALSEE